MLITVERTADTVAEIVYYVNYSSAIRSVPSENSDYRFLASRSITIRLLLVSNPSDQITRHEDVARINRCSIMSDVNLGVDRIPSLFVLS